MEKHLVEFGFLPPLDKGAEFVTVDILFKTLSGMYFVGFCTIDADEVTFTAHLTDFDYSAEDIDCWWYLPE